MEVRIQFFALCREKTGCDEATLTLDPATSLPELKQVVLRDFPELETLATSLIFAVNGKYVNDFCILNEGDTIACFPPVSGG